MKFLKSTFITFLTNIFIFGISFLITIFQSKLLTTNGRGTVGLGNNTIAFAMLILSLGIESSNVFFIGKNKKDINSILGVNIVISSLSFFVLIIVFVLNCFLKFSIFKGLDNGILIIIFMTTPIAILKAYFLGVLLGIQDIVKYNKITLIDRIMTFFLMLLILISIKQAYWVMVSNLVSNIVIILILMYILFYKNGYRIGFNKDLTKGIMKYGIKNQVGNVVQQLNYRLDVFIINIFLNLTQVGIYSNAVSFGESIWQVTGSATTIIYPMTANTKDKGSMKDFINKVARITLLIAILCCLPLIILCKLLIIFLLPQYSSAVIALIWLLPGICIFTLSKTLASYIAGNGQVEKNIIASASSCVITVVLDFLLIPRIGINGASIATSLSYIFCTFLTIIFYKNITESNVKDILFIKKQDLIDTKDLFIKLKAKFIK